VNLLQASGPVSPSPRHQGRAKRPALSLRLPSDAKLTICTDEEIRWERSAPGGYPLYRTRRFGLAYRVLFDIKNGQPCYAADLMQGFQGAVAPPIRVSAQAALKQARELGRKARGPEEASAEEPILTWTPCERRITPDIAAYRLRHVPRTSVPHGVWQLVWLVSWKGFTVGIDPASGVPVHFHCWMRYDLD